ncbi:hypothetical protein [Gluconobacter cerinus]|uniref:hypothetical protein n=1 Tax=Gluconobacter cerinus TaxID=38307 RepID=UPI001B8D876C|nr:hypothetical protein [Gluconobacter cerinus]MBS1038076.1 hypothetical protein [Gluconobacter cerinus]
MLEFAKNLFLKNGSIEPTAIIYKRSGSPLVLDIRMEHKETEYQALNLLCQSNDASQMIIISEAWLTLGADNIQSPTPRKREVLMLSTMNQDGVTMNVFEIDRRPDGTVGLDEINLPTGLPGEDITQAGWLTEIFPSSPLPLSEKRKARKVAEMIRKKNRK